MKIGGPRATANLPEDPRQEEQDRPGDTRQGAPEPTGEEPPGDVPEQGAVTGSQGERMELRKEDYIKCRTKNSKEKRRKTQTQNRTIRIFKAGQSKREG